MRTLAGSDAVSMLRSAAEVLIENEPALTRADQTIGDGDHGVGMTRGLKAALAALDRVDADLGPGAAFAAVGRAVLSSAGGASGAVFGTFFNAVGKSLAGPDADARALATAFGEGARAVKARGRAKAGDKTMLDALLPAVEALDGAASSDLGEALQAAAEAARSGAAATADMVAGTGRAKTLGARAIGHVDPGALSVSFLFEGMARAIAGAGKAN